MGLIARFAREVIDDVDSFNVMIFRIITIFYLISQNFSLTSLAYFFSGTLCAICIARAFMGCVHKYNSNWTSPLRVVASTLGCLYNPATLGSFDDIDAKQKPRNVDVNFTLVVMRSFLLSIMALSMSTFFLNTIQKQKQEPN